jgi:GntR family transcriptional regulator of arabinose operon
MPEAKTLKYKNVQEYILALAEDKKWQAGQRLPTELELVTQFRLSRNTVRQALTALEQEGLIYRRRGQGSFYVGQNGKESKKHFLIGVIMSQDNYIYTDIIRAAEKILNPAGYHLLLGTSSLSLPKNKRDKNGDVSWDTDGFLLEPWNPEMNEVMQNLRAQGTPYVLMNWTSEDPQTPFIAPNDVAAGESVFRYLHTRGHRRIAFFGVLGMQPSDNRLKGLCNAAEAAGETIDPSLIRCGRYQTSEEMKSDAYTVTRELIALDKSRPTAIFYFNDEAASMGYIAAREAGLTIPQDLSMIGFDNSMLSCAVYPPLTTLEHPKAKIGEMAARLLLDMINNPATCLPAQMLYSCNIIERGSVRNLE